MTFDLRHLSAALEIIAPRWRTWLAGGAVVVGSFLLARATAPRTEDIAIQRLEHVGFRATRRAALHRRLARAAMDSFHAAARRTDSTYAADVARLRKTAAGAFVGLPTHIDSAPRVIVGPASFSDSLVALPVARAVMNAIADSALAAMERLRAAALAERGRASLAILHLESALAATDTVIATKDSIIAQLKDERPGVLRRALGGIAHAGAGLACGAGGWAIAGPAVGIGAGALCAAIAGVVK